ncbi:MAG: hypothetical protein QOG03_544 [Actinomycetota bacterium]|nr:hypothetical protein [Actinomycetota bacterium]
MSPRPLRQFYGHDRHFALDGLGAPTDSFRRHRKRFLDALAGLSEEQWAAKTRCDAWNAKDVVQHLVSADGFWALTLQGRTNPEPTAFLRGFDPTTSPDEFIAPTREKGSGEALEAIAASTEQLAAALDGIGDDEWSLVSESPFGHMPVSVITSHALWDSWLHERDILLPLGQTVPVEEDELLTAAAFTLFLGGAQGGVLDDVDSVGDGPDDAIDASVAFDDLPGRALRVRIDRNVVVEAGTVDDVAQGGSALEFVEAVSGRAPAEPVLDQLPADLAAQLARSRQIL